MLERDAWRDRIPHAGRMALIERVLQFDADGIVAESDNHRAPDHPLRSSDRLHGVHLCEYGAQVMAVHGALCEGDGPARPGMLVALREVNLHVDHIDDLAGSLRIRAQREHADAQAWLYRFAIHHNDDCLAEGRAMVVLEQGVRP